MVSMSRGARTALLMFGDALLAALSMSAALFLRMEFSFPSPQSDHLHWMILLSAGAKIAALRWAGMYSVSLTFISLRDAVRLCGALFVASMVIAGVFLPLRTAGIAFGGFPLSGIVFDLAFFLPLIGFWRFSKRLSLLVLQLRTTGKPTLIVGAGNAADRLLRTMLADPRPQYMPVGLLDDDPAKRGSTLHGVPIAGNVADLPEILKNTPISTVVIAMPTAPAAAVRRAYELAQSAGVNEILVLPPARDLLRPEVTLRDLRRIELRDLLRRDEIKLDETALAPYYKGRTVLVTGAAGSIGSELCRQVCRLKPARLILLDREETGLFNIHEELKSTVQGVELIASLTDITERDRVAEALARRRPQIVFHAAAYKHVPMLETNAREALANNVAGTLTLSKECGNAGVEKFVFVSTDKAAEPISIMGKTKRVGELLARRMDRPEGTRFVAVRFGNVLGSRGSVLEIFAEQIRTGRPITLTSEEMTRYFMLVSEAVLLVLHAGAIGRGGETFVLDMGEPVRIRDLADQMARMAGLELGKDIPLHVTGLRPGERLEEKLYSSRERRVPTEHPKLFQAVPEDDAATAAVDLTEIEREASSANGAAEETIDRILRRLEGSG